MKQYLYIAILAAGVSSTGSAVASPGGSCHFHGKMPASETVILDCANQRKEALMANGKLDKSWQAVKVERAELVDGKKGKEWRVTLKDPSAKDKARETLYMFFTVPGNFIAANFTGQ